MPLFWLSAVMLWGAVTAEGVHIQVFHWALLLLENKQQLRRGETKCVVLDTFGA